MLADHRYLASLVALALLLGSSPGAEPAKVDYLRDIKPILKERCYACHGSLKQQGKLRTDTVSFLRKGGESGPALKAGHPTESEILERISDPQEASRMPPEGKPLTPAQISLIRAWIEQGAIAPPDEQPEADPRQHWSFQPLKRPSVPELGNPVDAFLAAQWARKGLKPVAMADKATLLRRVTFDLTGLPPTREELTSFLADSSPDAYERVVDRLLSSPAYGERWGRKWMDVWRYSDWYGRRNVPDVLNSYGQIWRWRDWIMTSLNRDRSLDEMIRLMLAADEIAPTSDDDQPATGFLVRNFFRWNYNNWMRDNVEHTAKAFLGLTMNCNHCHDHKYDPLTQQEYFAFRAIFEPLEIRHDRWPGEADPGVYPKYSYGGAYKPITSGMVRVMDEKPDAKTQFYTGGDERNVVKGKPPVPPGVPASLGGSFVVKSIELPLESWYPGLKEFVRAEERAKRVTAESVASAALTKTILTWDLAGLRAAELAYRAARADHIALNARIAADDVQYRGAPGDAKTASESAGKAERVASMLAAQHSLVVAEQGVPVAKATKDAAKITAAEKAVTDAKAKLEAATKALTTPVTGHTPLTAVYATKTSSGRRTALAKWITAPENPLTARVAVNHLWAGHFGQPLVESTNNFGRSGKSPSHPELLDWLACELVQNGWHTKPLHRLIVTSQAYRLQSRGGSESHRAIDPDNQNYWRFPGYRLEAEAIRDALLATAGELDRTAGGPELPQDQGLTSKRRSLYFSHHGEARMEFLELFDAANPCDAYRRTTSVLPQQALSLTNSELAIRMSRALAGKLSPQAKETRDFITLAFRQILGRDPTAAEAKLAGEFLIQQQALFTAKDAKAPPAGGPAADPILRARENLVLGLFNHSDFVTVR